MFVYAVSDALFLSFFFGSGLAAAVCVGYFCCLQSGLSVFFVGKRRPNLITVPSGRRASNHRVDQSNCPRPLPIESLADNGS